jgi:hypothetical protein
MTALKQPRKTGDIAMASQSAGSKSTSGKNAQGKAPETNTGTPPSPGKAKGRKPSRPLPTDRIAFPRQLDLLRAFAIASGDDRKAVRNTDVAEISDFASTTLSQANAFFVDVGFLIRTPEGFLPEEDVFAFAHSFKWNPITAAFKLSPIVARSWVGEALLPRLQFRDISEAEAIAALAEEVGVGPEYRAQLRLLLEYLEACDLVALDAGMVKVATEFLKTPEGGATQGEAKPNGIGRSPAQPAAAAFPAKAEAVVQPVNTLNLSVDIHVPMEELNKWSADRISAFFAGVAAVLAAKNGGDGPTV